jgi:hypothetical protein
VLAAGDDDDWTEKVGCSVDYLAKAGFMSPYGGEQAIEDIAEMTSWATVCGTPDEPEDGACQVMSGRAGPSINRGDAAAFTKLNFVRTLGFISEQHYKAAWEVCTLKHQVRAFLSYKNGSLTRSYTGVCCAEHLELWSAAPETVLINQYCWQTFARRGL